ncbi:hypothetical protein KO488_13695 [Poseidonibacter lekithochrous]|uniref:hypothetical protein n=1 Tax=Poseidonibacter TaxID=2321187 RepID=UPI001C085A35|nr:MULTISPECIES: hypothetical protein [Poseidonibacter]MBU3015816.1 hypothetical protein [Poseidonibacter lekithochrous]MDO6829116.1 hypothetical protein [Poseidonibacter sp. 1_MG-2023]
MNQPLINTGAPRNVLGHVVSGAVASAIVSGTINYKKLQERKISPNDAIKDTVKRTSQGAIATGSAIATANYIGQKGGLFKALTAASIGMAGIYALELIDNKLEEKDEFISESNNDLISEGE